VDGIRIVALAVEPFRFGWPEAKAVALAVAIIGTWAAIRYGRGARSPEARSEQ